MDIHIENWWIPLCPMKQCIKLNLTEAEIIQIAKVYNQSDVEFYLVPTVFLVCMPVCIQETAPTKL